jgi:hypothetical protein
MTQGSTLHGVRLKKFLSLYRTYNVKLRLLTQAQSQYLTKHAKTASIPQTVLIQILSGNPKLFELIQKIPLAILSKIVIRLKY